MLPFASGENKSSRPTAPESRGLPGRKTGNSCQQLLRDAIRDARIRIGHVTSEGIVTTPRRDLLKRLLTMTAMPGALGISGAGNQLGSFLDAQAASQINPDVDAKAFDFWSGFLDADAAPSLAGRKTRGGGQTPAAGANDAQPVFLHYGPEGFKDAAELSPEKLVNQGDVMVSLNTSTVKVGRADQKTFERVQNAQLRVDLAQKTGIIPIIEAMAYTVVGAMRSVEVQAKGTAAQKKSQPVVQSISVSSDATWQKMQNIPLPGGEGRWALNLEAQRKDSLFCKVLQNVVKQGGMFFPVLGFPGIALSALQSFNNLYGALHAASVNVIQSPPLRVFATQEAVQKTGAFGAAKGILLQSGTYILIPANQFPDLSQFDKLAVMQGRVVPPKTSQTEMNEAAADTLKDVTYVTFDVEVTPTTLYGGKK